jgi:hypothetical protein
VSTRRFTSGGEANGVNQLRLATLLDSLTLQGMNDLQQQGAGEIRAAAKQFADVLMGEAPYSRELSLAATALEEAVMWAIKAIVLHPDEFESEAVS